MEPLNAFLISTLFVAFLAISSSSLTDLESQWYKCANPKEYMPPGGVFGIVWTTLYIIFIYIFTRLLQQKILDKPTIGLLALINVMCALWVYVFFKLHEPGYSLGIIVSILILSVYATWMLYSCNHVTLSYMMFPFLAWISFATFLTYKTYEKSRKLNCY